MKFKGLEDTKVYVLIRSELSQAQRGVQGAHALAELVYDYGQESGIKQWVTVDKTLVFLKAKPDEFFGIVEKAEDDGVKFSSFVDSYYPDSFGWTAVAFYPMSHERGEKYFKGLSLA